VSSGSKHKSPISRKCVIHWLPIIKWVSSYKLTNTVLLNTLTTAIVYLQKKQQTQMALYSKLSCQFL